MACAAIQIPTMDIPICSAGSGSLKGLPQRLALRGARDMRISDVRAKLRALTGDHRATAGLVYRGEILEDDAAAVSDVFRRDGDSDSDARFVIFNRVEGERNPRHFFATPSGLTLTIDDRKDARALAQPWLIDEKINLHVQRLGPELSARASRYARKQARGGEEEEACDDDEATARKQARRTEAEVDRRDSGCDDNEGENDEETVLEECDAASTAGSVAVHQFHCARTGAPHLAVVGGVHGNERVGIAGAEHVGEFLRDTTDELAQAILQRATVTVIPCANTVGAAANARTSPETGARVLHGGGRAWVGDHQRGSLFPPDGWHDPNRGWERNDTLVKHALASVLFRGAAAAPSMVVWNHDWAVPQGKLMARGVERETYAACAQIFAKHYPTRTGFGLPYEHLVHVAPEDVAPGQTEPVYMPECLAQRFGTPSYTIETYCGGDAVCLHFETTLFLLAKHSGLCADDESALLRDVARATDALRAKLH